jgi:hypothetical protein
LVPEAPGKSLKNNEGKMMDIDSYHFIVGKIIFYATKIATHIFNTVRELSCHLSNPGEEHWKALERFVVARILRYGKNLSLSLKMSQNIGINL